MSLTPDAWAHFRGVALAVVIAANAWVAIPIGPRVTAKDLARGEVKEQVDEWMSMLSALGITRAQFETFVVKGSGFFVDLDNTVSKPIHPFSQILRTGQNWALFTGADRTPLRFTLRGITADGTIVPLFRRLDPDATFLGDILNFRRVRGIYDLERDEIPKRYRNLTRWIATRAFQAHPELVSIEVFQEEQRTPLPGQKADLSVKQRFKFKVTREDLMPAPTPVDGQESAPPPLGAPAEDPAATHGGQVP